MLNRGHSAAEWVEGESNLNNSTEESIQPETFTSTTLSDNINDNNEINENSLSHPFLIGLDRNFFEQGEDPKDVILIGNAGLKFDGPSSSNQKSFLSSGNYLISFVEPLTSVGWDQNTLRHVRIIRPDVETENGPANIFINSVDQSISHISLFDDGKNLENEAIGAEKETYTLENSYDEKKDTSICFENVNESKSIERVESTVKEKHLPPKKKTKMKNVNFHKSSIHLETEFAGGDDDIKREFTPNENSELSDSQNSHKKFKKRLAGQRRCCYSDSDLSDDEESITLETISRPDFENIEDLVSDLLLKNLVDEEFATLIKTGVAEMNTNIFEELNSAERKEFSFHVLTFAFLLYFKRRPAYLYLKEVYKTKWPGVPHLKEWRKMVNSKPRRRKKK